MPRRVQSMGFATRQRVRAFAMLPGQASTAITVQKVTYWRRPLDSVYSAWRLLHARIMVSARLLTPLRTNPHVRVIRRLSECIASGVM